MSGLSATKNIFKTIVFLIPNCLWNTLQPLILWKSWVYLFLILIFVLIYSLSSNLFVFIFIWSLVNKLIYLLLFVEFLFICFCMYTFIAKAGARTFPQKNVNAISPWIFIYFSFHFMHLRVTDLLIYYFCFFWYIYFTCYLLADYFCFILYFWFMSICISCLFMYLFNDVFSSFMYLLIYAPLFMLFMFFLVI